MARIAGQENLSKINGGLTTNVPKDFLQLNEFIMKARFFIPLLIVSLMAACNADPNVIDDDTPPIGPGQPLECDSLPVPNSVFPNIIGEMLVFTDSTNSQFDTLQCIENEAYNILVELPNDKYCEARYETGFSTHWLPAPEVYQVGFSSIWRPESVFFSAGSVTLDDFAASASVGYDKVPIYADSTIINGIVFHKTVSLKCAPNKPCTFVESFVFAKDNGLVAIKRENKWWTKK